MPSLYYHVEAPGVNILKQVTDEVVYGLIDELGLKTLFKDSVYIMSSFMASSQYSTDGKVNLINNRCDVDVSYIMDKSQVPWPVESPYTTTAYGLRATHKGNHAPILIDEKARIFIEHHTVASAIEMNFVMTFKTFDDACKAFDTIQSRYKGSLIQTPFDLSFSYPVSMGLFRFLSAVFNAKTDYKTKTILDYINDMKRTQISFDVRKSQLTSPDADKELMIRCQQLRCLAQITMDQKEPDPKMINDLPDSYTLSFNVVLQFGRPSLIAVHTPVSVDNTVLPFELFEGAMVNYHNDPDAKGFYQDLMVDEYMKSTGGTSTNNQRITRLPAYDDWFSVDRQYVFYDYRPFLIAHFTLDGPVTTFNLKDLDCKIHPIVQTLISETGNEIFEYGGLFNIGIYADTLRLGPELVSINADLDITVHSNRKDKVYHLILSETTSLQRTNVKWDQTLIKYRYFFPMTIERNLQTLVHKGYFNITADNAFLDLVSRLWSGRKLKAILKTMVDLGEVTNQVFSYTQNPSQIADYLTYTASQRIDYTIPTGTDDISVAVQTFYATKASTQGRSLFIAFLEQCLIQGYVTLDTIPVEYIEPDQNVFPYWHGQGNYYGFNTPLRILKYTIAPTQHHSQ